MKITENNIINKYLRKLTFNKKNSLNLEDDVYYDKKRSLVISTDTFEEGIHFFDSKFPKNFVKKIYRSAISDIFCKGVKPEVYFLNLSVKKTNIKWIKDFKNELAKESKKFGLYLGGGDTIKSKKLNISISVIGFSKKPVLRSTAKINDDLYLTGNIGDSHLGSLVIKKKINFYTNNIYYKKQYFEPKLPALFSKNLNKFASSSIDISDGLIIDLKKLCKASNCGAKINFNKIPFSKKTKLAAKNKKIKLENIFSMGDDYQIMFTSNKKNRKLINKIARKTYTKVSLIGVIRPENIVKLTKDDVMLDLSLAKSGYIHNF